MTDEKNKGNLILVSGERGARNTKTTNILKQYPAYLGGRVFTY